MAGICFEIYIVVTKMTEERPFRPLELFSQHFYVLSVFKRFVDKFFNTNLLDTIFKSLLFSQVCEVCRIRNIE